MRFALFPILIAGVIAGDPAVPATFQQALPFSDKGWTLGGEGVAVVRDGDRDILEVTTGFAHRREVSALNGTIEFDVQVTRRRSFVFVHFRVAGDGEREEFYLRPHKSGLPDAAQYAPVWQNRSAWQLHHGPGGTAAVEFDPGAWTRVRVVMQGRRAALFVKDMAKPVLLVPHVSREPVAGHIAIGGFVPPGIPGQGPIAKFADVVVRPDHIPFDFDAALAATPDRHAADTRASAGEIVRAWSVSRAFAPGRAAVPALPGVETTGEFQRLDAEPSGLLQLHRHLRVPGKSDAAAAVARIRVRAPRPGVYAFDLGYSDIATAFVNGRPVFTGDQSYSFDRPRREGLIGFDQARLYLPLNEGDNELAVLVSDSFGGWGLMGRFVGADGLSVEPF
jgi:hypothetical protein